MKKNGFFSRFLETMGIMVENVDEEPYDPTIDDDYVSNDFSEPVAEEQAPRYTTPVQAAPADEEPIIIDEPEEEPEVEQRRPFRANKRGNRAQKGNVIDMQPERKPTPAQVRTPISPAMSVLVYRPASFEETQKIIDNVKSQRPVIVNLDALDVDEAQRSLDFLSGASYALNGTVFKVASSIFVLAPYNVDVSGNISNEMYGEQADDFYAE